MKKIKILLIAPYGLGNTLLALPAMQQLRKYYPQAKIDILATLHSVYSLITQIPDFNLFDTVYRLQLINIIKIIFKRYDYSILFFPSAKIHYNFLHFLCLARKRIGSLYPDGNLKIGTFLNHIRIPINIKLHDGEQNLNFLPPLGIKPKKVDRIISKITVKNKKNYIGIHSGCKKKDYYKKWNIHNYKEVIDIILKRTKYKIKLFFGPDELEDYRFYYEHFGKHPRIDYIINKSMKELFQEINECKFFLSNDTGLMHIANFLGVYNIVVSGPSDYRRTGPYNQPYLLIKEKLTCIPCSHTYFVSSYKFNCIYGDVRCMKLITVEKVWKALEKII